MFESISFTYDGISSDDMGVVMFNPGSGLYKESFLPTRKIVEKQVAGRSKRYFKRMEEEPLSIPFAIYIEQWQIRDNLREIVRWFDQEYYKPFWFETNPDRIFYAIVEGASDLNHNGCKDGYINLTLRCDSPYSYSQPLTYKKEVRGIHEDGISNDGDKTIKPLIKFKKIGNGNINIKTYLEDKQVNNFEIKDLLDGELVEVDCENESIKTNYEEQGRYLLDNHNDDWIEFGLGYKYDGINSTKIVLEGDFDIEMNYQNIYLGD